MVRSPGDFDKLSGLAFYPTDCLLDLFQGQLPCPGLVSLGDVPLHRPEIFIQQRRDIFIECLAMFNLPDQSVGQFTQA
jgi:hypothetical protein